MRYPIYRLKICLGVIMALAITEPNAQENDQGKVPIVQNPNGFAIGNDLMQRFESFRVEAEKLNLGDGNLVLPEAMKQQFVDVVNDIGLATKKSSDFFIEPDPLAGPRDDGTIDKLSETARAKMASDAWDESRMQIIYGRVLNQYDPQIPAGVATGTDRQFFEGVQTLVAGLPGYAMHVVSDDSMQGANYFTQSNFPGPPIFGGGGPAEAFPKRAPFILDKTGLLPGVGVIVERDRLKPVAGGWELTTTDVSLPFDGVRHPPCEDEESFMYRHRNSPRLEGRVCTAFLLGSDSRLMTARHCMHDINQPLPPGNPVDPSLIHVKVDQYAVVFGFQTRDAQAGQTPTVFPAENVYFFSEAITTELIFRSDIIELDLERSVPPDVATFFVSDNRPLDMSLVLLRLTVAGYPVGMPLSIDAEETQLIMLGGFGRFFVGGDNYHGDSGAPVFDFETGNVIGLMVGGRSDFELKTDREPACYIANRTELPEDSLEAALHLASFMTP